MVLCFSIKQNRVQWWSVEEKVWSVLLTSKVRYGTEEPSLVRTYCRARRCNLFMVVVLQRLSHVWLLATSWTVAPRFPCLSLFPWVCSNSCPLSQWCHLLKLTSIESVMPSSHLILCRPLLLLPPTPPSIRVFFNESTLHMTWPKYWSFSFSISPSKEHPGLISFRMDWLDLLEVQGILKSLLQYHSSKA